MIIVVISPPPCQSVSVKKVQGDLFYRRWTLRWRGAKNLILKPPVQSRRSRDSNAGLSVSVFYCPQPKKQKMKITHHPITNNQVGPFGDHHLSLLFCVQVSIHNFSNSSIISTQLSLALCSSHVFLSCWPKSTAAFSGRTLPSSSIVSHAIQMRFSTLPYPLPVSKWPCYPGLASWLGLESKCLILGVTLCKPDPWEKIFWDHCGGEMPIFL